MEKVSEYDKIIEEISRTLDSNWSAPRAKIYIAATLFEHRKCIEKLSEELKFERAVNERVLEVVKAWLAIRPSDESLSRV